MKKKLYMAGLAAFLIVFCAIGYIAVGLAAPSQWESACGKNNASSDKELVAIIGDSWVAGGKLDSGIQHGIADSGVSVTVKSSGHPGARSKAIYEDMKGFLGWARDSYPDYRKTYVIEGGINDSLAFIGSDKYVKSMVMAATEGLKCDDKVVVLTIPRVERRLEQRSFFTRIRWMGYRLLSGDDDVDNAAAYNASMSSAIQNIRSDGRLLIIDLREILSQKEFIGAMPDGVHLTPEKFDVLAYQIGRKIGSLIKN